MWTQGRVAYPHVFRLINIIYHDFISILSNCTGGITIHNESYNVFCYAADLINAAKSYIVEHGLNFNTTKKICKTFGTCNTEKHRKWYLNSSLLHSDNLITSLGTLLTGNVTDHINTKIQAARRAHYDLQSSGA